MEFSLTDTRGKTFSFPSLQALVDFIKQVGEIDGWTIRVHWM